MDVQLPSYDADAGSIVSCSHPDWQFPSPLPDPGERCYYCDEPYTEPSGIVNGVPWSNLDAQIREDLRFLGEVRGLQCEIGDRAINTRTGNNAIKRLVAKGGYQE